MAVEAVLPSRVSSARGGCDMVGGAYLILAWAGTYIVLLV
jgi:hypothetical protein